MDVHEAKSQLSCLIEAALDGRPVTITRAGEPVVDLVPHQGPRVIIGLDGWRDVQVDPTMFDGAHAEVNEMFYG